MAEQKQRGAISKKLLIFTGSVFVLLIIVIAIVSGGGDEQESVTTSTSSSTSSTENKSSTIQTETESETETETETTSAPVTFQPVYLSGSGDKTTAPFTVTTREWIIDWTLNTTDDDFVFCLFCYPRGETVMYVESIGFPDAKSGSTYSYAGPGEYYIKVISSCPWEVTIQPAP